MPRPLSTPMARAILAQRTTEVPLACVTITHPTLEPIRIVNNNEPIGRLSGVYRPYPMEPQFPGDGESASPTVQLRIDNVDREVTRLVRNLPAPRPKCTLELVLASSPDLVEMGPFEFAVLGADYDVMVLELTLGYEEDFLNQGVPAQSYTPSNSPALFL